jgi:hypothetical protein
VRAETAAICSTTGWRKEEEGESFHEQTTGINEVDGSGLHGKKISLDGTQEFFKTSIVHREQVIFIMVHR